MAQTTTITQTNKTIRQAGTSANSTNRSWACGANPSRSSPSAVIATATRKIQRINAHWRMHCQRRKKPHRCGIARSPTRLVPLLYIPSEKFAKVLQCRAAKLGDLPHTNRINFEATGRSHTVAHVRFTPKDGVIGLPAYG